MVLHFCWVGTEFYLFNRDIEVSCIERPRLLPLQDLDVYVWRFCRQGEKVLYKTEKFGLRCNYLVSGGSRFLPSISPKYCMVLTFESIAQTEYISEKIAHMYKSGTIPVHCGPPEVYPWVPVNHTVTFIDRRS